MFEWEVRYTFNQTDLAVGLSILLHIIALVVFHPSMLDYSLFGKNSDKEIYEVDIDRLEYLKKLKNKKLKLTGDLGFVSENPDLYIWRKKKVQKKLNPLEKLLSNIDHKSFNRYKLDKVNVEGIPPFKIKLSERKALESNIEEIEKLALQAEEQDKAAKLSYKEIQLLLSKHYSKFRKCYEKSLIIDEFLGGNITIIGRAMGSAQVSFRGVGSNQGVNTLKACLKSTWRKIPLPRRLKDKNLKFNLYFKS